MNFCFKIVLFVLFSGTSNLTHSSSLNLYLEAFPPYNYIENGKINCSFTLLPWTRAWHLALNENNTGLYSTGMSSKRQNLFKWVGPLVSSRTSLYKLKHRSDIVYSEQNKLKGYSIAVVRDTVTKHVVIEQGYASEEDFIEFSYLEQYIPLFFTGKVDLIPGSVITSPFHLPRLGYDYADLEIVVTIDDEGLGNYLALNKSVSDEMVQKMNHALVQLKEQGRLKTIIQKYSSS